jgi:hypothetical protein
MDINYLDVIHSDQSNALSGRHQSQYFCGADQYGHLTHSFLVKKINPLWQLIDLRISFSISNVNYLLVRGWESRSNWVNMIANGWRK